MLEGDGEMCIYLFHAYCAMILYLNTMGDRANRMVLNVFLWEKNGDTLESVLTFTACQMLFKLQLSGRMEIH